MGIVIIGANAHRLTKFVAGLFVVTVLGQYQADVVVSFSIFRAQAQSFLELGHHLARIGSFAAKYETNDVVHFRTWYSVGTRFAKPHDSRIPIGSGKG
jgi:hypothetical protein